MLKGIPYHATIGHCGTKYAIRAEIGDSWYSPKDLGSEAESIWGETTLDLTSRDDVSSIEFSVTLEGRAGFYADAYSIQKIDQDCRFGVRMWNKSSRVRRLVDGGKFEVTKGRDAKFVASLSIARIDLSEFSGEIEFEPVLYTVKRLHDRTKKDETHYVAPGTVIAWGDPFTVYLERSRQGLSTLFDFRFCNFEEDTENDLPRTSFFAVKWEPKPILFLDTGVEGLYQILMSRAKTGKVARARDSINATIAHGVLSSVMAASLQSAASIHESDRNMSFEGVLSMADPQERAVLSAWLPFLGTGGGKEEPSVVLEEFLTLDRTERADLLAERLNDVLSAQLRSRKIVQDLIEEFGLLVGVEEDAKR